MGNIFEEWANQSDAFEDDGEFRFRDDYAQDKYPFNGKGLPKVKSFQPLPKLPTGKPQRESRHKTRHPIVNNDSRYDGDEAKPLTGKQLRNALIEAEYYSYDNTPTVSGGAAFLIVVLAFMVVVGLITMF